MYTFLLCLSGTVSELAGGVTDILSSVTLIINLNAVEGADNKGPEKE